MLGDARGLHDRAVGGDVALQDAQAAVGGVGVLDRPDAAVRGVRVEVDPPVGRGEGLRGADAAGRGVPEVEGFRGGLAAADVPVVEPLGEAGGVDGVHVGVQQPAAVQLAEDGRHAAGAVDVLHPELGGVRGHLGQARGHPREGVDVVLVKSTPASMAAARMCSTVFVEPPIAMSRRMALLNASLVAMLLRQHRVVVAVVIALGQVDHEASGPQEQVATGGRRGQRRAVARQGQAEGLGEAVHRVGGEHARARAARRTGVGLDLLDLLVGDGRVDGLDHRVDEVEALVGAALVGGAGDDAVAEEASGLHGSAGDEHGRDVQPQRGQQHARG